MRILSIDVGMRNLAYCYIDVKLDKTFSIAKWEVVNLCLDEPQKCCGIISNKRKIKDNKKENKKEKKCDKNARYYFNNDYYCKIHAKKTDYIIPTTELYPSRLNKYKLIELYQIADKYEVQYEKPLLKAALLDKINLHLKDKFFQIVQAQKADKMNLVDLGKNMMDHFDEHLNIETNPIDAVLIENQISTLATRMKTLQGMITQYFIMKGIEKIEFISSANKLKPFIDKKKTTYAERKKIGISITRRLVNEQSFLDEWKELFNDHKKKDDLADSFLQGLWFLRENKEIEDGHIFNMK